MANEIQVWNKVMSAALSLPGVKVNREEFLKEKLSLYCNEKQLETALSMSPVKVFSRNQIDKIADSVISSHVIKVTAISTVAGIPGGLAMAATIPSDIAQYYYHVFNLSQKLAYLYGYPDLLDENGKVTDATINLLTVFSGVMMGAAVANNAIREISKQLAETAIKKLPQQALTKGAIYPLVKKVASWIGVKLTKESFAKGVGKVIPVLGGIISGGLTLATFRPGAKRLQKTLQGEMEFFVRSDESRSEDVSEENETAYTPYEEVNESTSIDSIEYHRILTLISIAFIDNDITTKERAYINTKIEEATLTDDQKLELITILKDGNTPKITFDVFTEDNKEGIKLLSQAIEMLKLDRRFTLGERLYIKKIGKELGFGPEDVENLMKEA
ncbi:MAG: hypothetical protein IKH58_04090 [Bacteroidales bacterium]|nr:hypothetical protein [Bacteroidales bacterium]